MQQVQQNQDNDMVEMLRSGKMMGMRMNEMGRTNSEPVQQWVDGSEK